MGKNNNEIHERHPVPSASDTAGEDKPVASNKSTAQETRDAHYFENGVKADGTGGVPPESEL